MKKILIIAFIIAAFKGNAQDKVLPAEAKQFVLKGYEMLDYITGDLNGDKRPDAVLILKVQGEDTLMDTDFSVKRPLILLLRGSNGKLSLAKRNDNMMLCRQCGGAFGDPYAGTSIKNNTLIINFYGGSSWRWGYEYTFSYNATAKNWLLTKESDENYQDGDPDATMKRSVIGAAELTGKDFDNFNVNPVNEDSKWRVTADKTFFYDNPGIGNKPRKGYLLKGNVVSGIRELKNFMEVSFENGKEQFTTGFVLKKDLVKIK
jgi:hypothetical protein